MHIWIVNFFDEFPAPGRYDGRIPALVRALIEKGHTITWWTSDWSHRYKQKRTPQWDHPAIEIHTLPARPYRSNLSINRVLNHYRYAKDWQRSARQIFLNNECQRPDSIFVNTPPPSLAATVVDFCNEWKIPSIVDIRDAWPEAFLQLFPIKGAISRWLATICLKPFQHNARKAYQQATCLSAVSRDYLGVAAQHGRADGRVFYIGAPEDRFTTKPRPMSERPIERLELVYIGGMSRSYDLDTLIHALSLLPEGRVRLHLAGYGNQLPHLRNLAKRLGVYNALQTHGMLDQTALQDLLTNCHLAINAVKSSSAIAMPNKIGDYFTAGLPVLHSRPSGELAELIHLHKLGATYHSGDHTALASLIQSFRDEAAVSKLNQLSLNAYAFAAQHLDRREIYPEFAEWITEKFVGVAS